MNNLIPLLLFTFSTTFTPGPNNLMMLNSGLHFGVKKSFPSYIGVCLGYPLMVLMVALGLGVVFTKYSWIKQVLKIIGSLYMLYLAWQILISASKEKMSQARKPLRFSQTVIVQWINPKAWLMAIGAISLFTITTNYFYNALIIGFVCFFMCVPCTGSWLLFGTLLQRILKKDSHRIWFNIAMALALVASIGMIFVE
ncbi:MAG: LysE family translocator [Gammaproteobacteria bacterium]|nr:MAG: LysE family translocator [Gammaproteobacteria bacterium]